MPRSMEIVVCCYTFRNLANQFTRFYVLYKGAKFIVLKLGEHRVKFSFLSTTSFVCKIKARALENNMARL
jgi:hypothetical protein